MDAANRDVGSAVHEPPGRDEGEGEGAPAASTDGAPSPVSAGTSSLPEQAQVALPGLINTWRDRWCIRYEAGMYTGQRRDHDKESGACVYLDVFISASTPEALDAEITKWEAAQ